jgi:hexosaminidase
MQNVLAEVMELFPGTFIHVGGDEALKHEWSESRRVQERMLELGLKSEEELQSWFIAQLDKFISSKGRRLIGWDEILEGGLASGASVMSWRGIEGGIEAASSGHDVVMAPTRHTYLDYYQSKDTTKEPLAIGGYLPLEQVYSFEPIPSELSAHKAKHILGAQAQLWTEYVPNPEHAEYMYFPRLCALAELTWTSAKGKNRRDFIKRLKVHLRRLEQLKVNYRKLGA